MTTNNYSATARTDSGYFLQASFFLLLPFVYASQVIVGSATVALIGYAPLLLLTIIVVRHIGEYWSVNTIGAKGALLLILAVAAHNGISGIYMLVEGDFPIAGRVLILFTLPIVVFMAGSRLSLDRHWTIVKIIAWTACVVALEMLWENFNVWILREPTFFQLRNFNYVMSNTGAELNQLWAPGYRPTGLLEHVHVSTFYLLLGLFAGISIYLKTGERKFLLLVVLCEFTVIVHGVRFPLLVGSLASIFYIAYAKLTLATFQPLRVKILVVVCGMLALVTVVLDPFGTVSKFYLPVLIDGVWNQDAPETTTVLFVTKLGVGNLSGVLQERLASPIISWDFIYGFFGHGIANSLQGNIDGLNDDFFVAQIFAQYGLVGGLVFYLLLVGAPLMSVWVGKNRKDDHSLLLIFVATSLIVIGASTLHSGVIQRKVTFGVWMWLLSIIFAIQQPILKGNRKPIDEKCA